MRRLHTQHMHVLLQSYQGFSVTTKRRAIHVPNGTQVLMFAVCGQGVKPSMTRSPNVGQRVRGNGCPHGPGVCSVCPSGCMCRNGHCHSGVNGTGLCLSCKPGYYGQYCDCMSSDRVCPCCCGWICSVPLASRSRAISSVVPACFSVRAEGEPKGQWSIGVAQPQHHRPWCHAESAYPGQSCAHFPRGKAYNHNIGSRPGAQVFRRLMKKA